MIIKIKQGDSYAVFGTHLSLWEANELMLIAIEHNKKNFTYPYFQEGMQQIFQNIVDEFKFLDEFDRAYSIHEDDVEVTFELFFHGEHGLMGELTSKFMTHPQRVY
jgi:hypothetical protein